MGADTKIDSPTDRWSWHNFDFDLLQLISMFVTELLRFSHCELLLFEAGSWGQGQFGNPEEGECMLLEAATKQGLVKIITDWEDLMYPIVIFEVCRTVRA
jgi:hypothetical protein